MKPSEGLRKGMALNPQLEQARDVYVHFSHDKKLVAVCANTMTFLGVAPDTSRKLHTMANSLFSAYDFVRYTLPQFYAPYDARVRLPARAEGGDMGHEYRLWDAVVLLNDEYHWTFVQIADWLEEQGH